MQSIGLILFVGTGLEEDPRVGLFGWLNIAGYAVVGLVGIFFASRTGFPAALDPQISNRRRFLLPLAVGMGFGLLTILIEQFTHSIEFFLAETGMPRFNAQLPGSLLLYPGGAIILKLIYRLLPVSLETWLISSVILRGRWQTQVFWVLAAASSTLEPSGQTGWVLERSLPMFLALYTSGFAFNLTQAYFFPNPQILWAERAILLTATGATAHSTESPMGDSDELRFRLRPGRETASRLNESAD